VPVNSLRGGAAAPGLHPPHRPGYVQLGTLATASPMRLPRLHPHMLRHTYVTTMLDARRPKGPASNRNTSTPQANLWR
jgi:integrase